MKAIVIGTRDVSFAAKDSGEVINGKMLVFAYDDKRKGGITAAEKYLSGKIALPSGVDWGTGVDIDFDINGKIVDIKVIREKGAI